MPRTTLTCGLLLTLSLAATAQAEVSKETIDAIGAPDSIDTRIGTLEFKDGVPTDETAQKVFGEAAIRKESVGTAVDCGR
jgi:methenyltetrahydromethanopterin cyclohydrolase